MPSAIMQIWDTALGAYRDLTTTDLAAIGGGGGGDATLAEQQAQTMLQTTIAAACDVPLSDVVAAIDALGGAASIADVVGLLTTDATAQSNILAKLTDIEVDTTATVSSLQAIEPDVEEIRSDADATRIAIEALNAKFSQLENGFVSVRMSDGAAFYKGLTDIELRATPVPVSGTITANLGTLNGAATAAKQPALGTAGTPSSDVISVQGIGGGTALPVSATSLPLPTGAATSALQGGGLPAALGAGGGLKIDGSGTALPVSGNVTVTPSGTQNVAAASQAATAFFPVQIAINGTTFAPSAAPSANLSAPSNTAVNSSYAMGRAYASAGSPGLGNVLHVDNFGRTRTQVIRNLTADGTTDAPTNFGLVASSSGVAIVKATAGRLFEFDAYYAGTTASGLYLQLHNAASATTPTTGTIVKSWPMDTARDQIEKEFSAMDMCCSAGIKFAASTTRLTYTAAAAESFTIGAWGA